MNSRVMLACAALILALPACAGTAQQVSSEDAAHYQVVTWQEVNDLMEQGAVLVDARSAERYEQGHIEGAINVPFKDANAWSSLATDKSKKMIFYCGGPYCSLSGKAAAKASSMGYPVAEYKGGYPEWKQLIANSSPAPTGTSTTTDSPCAKGDKPCAKGCAGCAKAHSGSGS